MKSLFAEASERDFMSIAAPQSDNRITKLSTWYADLLAGLTGAAAGIPQGMAFSLIAGVSPIHGLVSACLGTAVGAISSNTPLLTIGPTNAVALAVGAAMAQTHGADPITTLVGLTLLVGLFQALAGLFKLGGITRYVSHAVMTGFISGAALLIMLGQTGPLLGLSSQVDSSPLARFVDIVIHIHHLHLPTLLTGLLTIGIVLALKQTRLKPTSWLLAIIAASLVTKLGNWQDVRLVADISAIPASLPRAILPDIRQLPDLIVPALAVSILGLVQSTGLVRSISNPDGKQTNLSQDFLAQGLSNLAVACFQGLPVAGSISRTAVNVAAGAQTRLSNLIAGVLVGIVLYSIGPLAGYIPLSALAGVLFLAAISLIEFQHIHQVWSASLPGRLAMMATFILTLILPLEQSIYFGVLLSLALYLYSSTQQVRLVQLIPQSENEFIEASVPDYIPASHPLILAVHGTIYFGAVYTLEQMLPKLNGVCHPVVIFRLRGEDLLDTTFLRMLEDYAHVLNKAKGRLILTGLSEEMRSQLIRAGILKWLDPEDVICASPVLLEVTRKTLITARQWQRDQHAKI